MDDEEFDKLYSDILENIKDTKCKEKFKKLISAMQDSISNLSEYAEVDCTAWGNPIF